MSRFDQLRAEYLATLTPERRRLVEVDDVLHAERMADRQLARQYEKLAKLSPSKSSAHIEKMIAKLEAEISDLANRSDAAISTLDHETATFLRARHALARVAFAEEREKWANQAHEIAQRRSERAARDAARAADTLRDLINANTTVPGLDG